MRKFLLVIPAALVLGALMGCGAKFTGYCSLSCQDSPPPPPPPTPAIISIFPSMVIAGGPTFTLTVKTDFTTSSPILWNGSPLPTTIGPSGGLQAQVPSADTATSGTATISVNGSSNTESFTIESNNGFTFSSVAIQANDMVWDPISQQIYLSVMGSNGTNGNTITALNPSNGQLGISQSAGSNPDQLALASGGSYLYAGIDGTGSIQRFTLPGLGMDINIPLGSFASTPCLATDMEAAPGSPHTIAVLPDMNYCLGMNNDVVIYDDAIARPASGLGITFGCINFIQWGPNATQIYGLGISDGFFALSVSSGGVQLVNDYPRAFASNPITGYQGAGLNQRLHYDATTGYLYGDDGAVVNPSTGAPVGTFAASGLMVPDGTLGLAYFIGQTQSEFLAGAESMGAGSGDYTIEVFDLTHFTPINSIVIPNVAGTPVRLIRWGTNGLAFLTNNNNNGPSTPIPGMGVYLISGVFVTNPSSLTPTSLPPAPLIRNRAMPTRSASGSALGNAP